MGPTATPELPRPPPWWPRYLPTYLPEYLSEGLHPRWSVRRQGRVSGTRVTRGPLSWWLLSKLRCRITSNVLVVPLQYDITFSNFRTSGTFFVTLNVLFVRYRRELFINKSVQFLCSNSCLVFILILWPGHGVISMD